MDGPLTPHPPHSKTALAAGLRPAEAVARYKGLADIERGFRVLKCKRCFPPTFPFVSLDARCFPS